MGQARLMDHSGMNPPRSPCQPGYDLDLATGLWDDVLSSIVDRVHRIESNRVETTFDQFRTDIERSSIECTESNRVETTSDQFRTDIERTDIERTVNRRS